MEEQLKDQIKKLEQELQQTTKENRKLAEAAATSRTSSGSSYHPKPEKTLKKFKETDDVTDWIDVAQRHISRMKDEDEKVDMLMNFMDRNPRLEVKFRINRSKCTADDIFTVLKDTYGLKDTQLQLEKAFFSRDQEPGEDLTEYSLALMEILMNLEKRNPDIKETAEKKLKGRFAEGVRDVSLRRELTRLNKERPKLKFFELRDEAAEWLKKDRTIRDTATAEATVETVSTQQDGSLSHIMQLLQEQQLQIQKLTENTQNQQFYKNRFRGRGRGRFRGRSNFNRSFSHSPQQNPSEDTASSRHAEAGSKAESTSTTDDLTCRYCGQANHFERFCIKKKRDQQKSLNFPHPK